MMQERMTSRRVNRFSGNAGRRLALAGVIWAAACMVPALASGDFDLFGIDTQWKLAAGYSYAVRLDDPAGGIINSAPRAKIPLPDAFKFPESNNYDDGDRNFDRWDAVHNRVSLKGQLRFNVDQDTGAVIGGRAFYDRAYLFGNANDAPDRLNTYQNYHHFTSSAKRYNGRRAILGSAYAYKTFYPGGHAFQVRAGRQAVAWGQSLFFSGIALAQNPSNAAEATVPGATARDIIMPSTQVAMTFDVTDNLTLKGQYKLLYRSSELNPVGGFDSRADIVGPGARFAYGLKNPLYSIRSGQFDVDLSDPSQIPKLLDQFGINVDDLSQETLVKFAQGLPYLNPDNPDGLDLAHQRAFNVKRGGVEEPRNGGQWGVGLVYDLNFTSSVGLYYLDYADPNPTVRQNYGDASLVGPDSKIDLDLSDLNISLPTSYTIKYYDHIHLVGLTFSTLLGGVNVGAETLYRHGADVLVEVNQPFNGDVPTPTRADTIQQLVNGIYSFGPGGFWDSVDLAGSLGYIHTFNVHSKPNLNGQRYDELKFDQDAAAYALLATFHVNAIFPGWDLSIPISTQGAFYNHAALSGAFGSLAGQGDYRVGGGLYFTRLQKLTLGLQYTGYLGKGDFDERPLQDRDTLGASITYQF